MQAHGADGYPPRVPALTRPELFGRFASYLLTCFDAGELRRLISYLPDGTEMARSLPSSEVSAAAIARAAVEVLDKHDYLHGKSGTAFWDSFKRDRPRRADQIEQWQAAFATGQSIDGSSGSDGADPPETLEILLVSASPIRVTRQLAVDEEFAQIIDRLRHRSNLKIVQRVAVTFDRLQSALNDHSPQILHISCHGEPGYLHFASGHPGGASARISQDALVHALDALDRPLRLVVLNACDTLSIAQRIVAPEARVAEWAIGMNAPIYDHDAISFSSTLYDTLAAGRSLDAAFKSAVARLMAEAPPSEDAPHEIPRLVPDDRAQAKKTVLVAPSAKARIE